MCREFIRDIYYRTDAKKIRKMIARCVYMLSLRQTRLSFPNTAARARTEDSEYLIRPLHHDYLQRQCLCIKPKADMFPIRTRDPS